jgi:hypothetical protein
MQIFVFVKSYVLPLGGLSRPLGGCRPRCRRGPSLGRLCRPVHLCGRCRPVSGHGSAAGLCVGVAGLSMGTAGVCVDVSGHLKLNF